jgi:hypothetical protein
MSGKISFKWCSGCFKMVLTSNFHKRKDAKDGLQNNCKMCNGEQVKLRRDRYYTENNLKKQAYVRKIQAGAVSTI